MGRGRDGPRNVERAKLRHAGQRSVERDQERVGHCLQTGCEWRCVWCVFTSIEAIDS